MAIISTSGPAATRGIRNGTLRRVAPGIYTDDITSPIEGLVAREWKAILADAMPGAVLTDRSGFDGRPLNGMLYVAHDRVRVLALPGLTIAPRAGLPAQPDDIPLGEGIYLASEHRALVDNLTPSRTRVGVRRTLTRDELHDKVAHIASSRSPQQQANLAVRIADYADRAGVPDRADDLRVFFDAARGKRPTVSSGSAAMRAAQQGKPYDQRRVNLFEEFAGRLAERQPKVRPAGNRTELLPFFEAYFSNFIEGTEFTVDEAKRVIFDDEDLARPEDAHDIRGTYEVLIGDGFAQPIADAAHFLDLLKERHSTIMAGRPGKHPGVLKTRANRAGLTQFVDPDKVEGTLTAGFDFLLEVDDPFARATYLMFLVSEVHPFDDGNGRLARLMMNAELDRAGETHILIPTILRNDYLSALTKLTHNQREESLLLVFDFAQRYTRQVDFSTLASALTQFEQTNAFADSNAAERSGLKLILPSDVPRQYEPPEIVGQS